MATVIKAGDPARLRGEQQPKVAPIVPFGLLEKLLKVQWVDLRALKESQKISMILPNRDSFLLTIGGFHWLLDRLGFSKPESIGDYAWNFKETTLDLETGVITCTYERNRRIGRP